MVTNLDQAKVAVQAAAAGLNGVLRDTSNGLLEVLHALGEKGIREAMDQHLKVGIYNSMTPRTDSEKIEASQRNNFSR